MEKRERIMGHKLYRIATKLCLLHAYFLFVKYLCRLSSIKMADPSESQVTLTEEIKRCIRTLLLTESIPNETREELLKYTKNRRNVEDKKSRTIPFRLVQVVHKHLGSEQGEGLFIFCVGIPIEIVRCHMTG